MPLNLASPGIVVREVDLTLGRIDPTSDKTGALVGPFARGPVELPTVVGNEAELLDNFGQSYDLDKQYETWLVGSSYLAYGGSLSVTRADDSDLKNSFYSSVGYGTGPKIKSATHYSDLGYDGSTITNYDIVSRDPGSWANTLRVAMIDGKSDQQFSGITTTGLSVGMGVSQNIPSGTVVAGLGGTSTLDGYLKGIITEVGASNYLEVKLTQHVSSAGVTTDVDYTPNGTYRFIAGGSGNTGLTPINSSGGVPDFIANASGSVETTGVAGTSSFVITGDLTALVSAGSSAHVGSALTHVSISAVSLESGNTRVTVGSTTGLEVSSGTGVTFFGQLRDGTPADWFDSQSISLSNGNSIQWNQIAQRPTTSGYADVRSSKNDEVHVVVIDDDGEITGNTGTILEKHLSLSKASDAEFSVGSPSYYRKYVKNQSEYIYAGGQPANTVATGFGTNTSYEAATDIAWDQPAQGIIFAGIGNTNMALTGGVNYGGKTGTTNTAGNAGGLTASAANIRAGFELYANADNYDVDFVLMGSANLDEAEAQSVALKAIDVAERRKDAIAFVSPYRKAIVSDAAAGSVTVNSDTDITNNVVSFFGPLTSSSFAVFDSGYKYMFDRFNNAFRYVPLNGDIAGICARNDINNFPWFSPAGTLRGTILNAVKVPYNPNQQQRDVLYSNRVNPVIFQSGSGIVLFGDKTALAKSSAFDRINVRRLFIYLENAISAAAKDQLFEFNDEITRTNFVNTVEPFLRDVQSKRGITDFVVVCDETNNTAAVIDNNEFVADIFIKPARSINFIGLTFVATRTGVDFAEVIGNV